MKTKTAGNFEQRYTTTSLDLLSSAIFCVYKEAFQGKNTLLVLHKSSTLR